MGVPRKNLYNNIIVTFTKVAHPWKLVYWRTLFGPLMGNIFHSSGHNTPRNCELSTKFKDIYFFFHVIIV